jgi:cell division protein FtsQ
MNARRKPRSSRRLVAAVVAFAAVCVLGVIIYRGANDPLLALGTIAVTGGRHTGSSDILLAAALKKGSNVWLLDTSAAERRIEMLPWIDQADVRRAWPDRVSISVTERTPVARVAVPDTGSAEEPAQEVALIDASMRVLALGQSSRDAKALPLFRIAPQPAQLEPGAEVRNSDIEHVYDAMVQLRALGLRILEVDLKPTTGVTVMCDDGLHVILGSDGDLAKKVSLLKAIAPKITAPRDVVYVDLRSVRAPTVLYR